MSASNVDIKVVLLGHKSVGKTSIFNRYIYDDFGKTSMTIGAYFAMKQCKIKEKSYSLAIWDTAGEERFDSLTSFYCRNARAAMICYDITNAASFTGIQKWIEKINSEAEPNCAIIIVGNKADIVEANPAERKVEFAAAKQLAKSINAEILETSALSGENVQKAFTQLVATCLQRQSAPAVPANNKVEKSTVELKQSSGKSCC